VHLPELPSCIVTNFLKRSVACASLALSLVPFYTAHADETQTSLSISTFLTQVQKGINLAKTQIDQARFPPLDSVTLVLQTETQYSGTAHLNLWFIKLGGGTTKTNSGQMTLILKPPKTVPAPVAAESFDRTLAQAIIGAAKGVKDAQLGDPPLKLDSFTADFGFTVNVKGDAGIEIKLVPIGGDAELGASKTNVHKMTVKFAYPSPGK
jgi:hypothetical protein